MAEVRAKYENSERNEIAPAYVQRNHERNPGRKHGRVIPAKHNESHTQKARSTQKTSNQSTLITTHNTTANSLAYARSDQTIGTYPKVVKKRKFYDYNLFAMLIFIFTIGLLVIYSSSQYVAMQERGDASYYFLRQLRIGSVGLILAVVISLFDYKILSGIIAKAGYILAVGLLGLTLMNGIGGGGKIRWLEVAGQTFQPTELAKLLIIIWAAAFISKRGTGMNRRENLLRMIVFALLPAGMIVTNNISSAIIVIMIVAVMLFVSTSDYKIYAGLLTMGGLSIAALKVVLYRYIIDNNITERPEQYWLRRIYAWVAPEIFTTDAYQTTQGIYAIGSGGLTGQGLGGSIQKYGTIPEVQNDMIFSVFCEEFGFIGAATLIILYIFLLYRIYIIARNARDLFGTMICTGVMAHIGVQVAFNLAVVTGVMPNTGVTLPFISYGGSAVLFTMVEMGLVLSVAHQIEY